MPSPTTHLMQTYARQPVSFVRGQGARLWDDQGIEYLDAIAGVAVTNLGHAHPEIAAAIAEQAGLLLHTSNMFGISWQQQLGERLCALAGMERAFFCNSGAEANETALKLARLHAHRLGAAQPQVLVMENSFHGRTFATLAATGNPAVHRGFEPLMPGFVRVPYNDLDAVRAAAVATPGIVAVLVEPVQGEGGVRVASRDYLRELRSLCNEHGWLFMVDEVQTGMGRTGAWFGFEHASIVPDVITLAKGLGNGFPIGACLARGEAAELFTPGHHGSTLVAIRWPAAWVAPCSTSWSASASPCMQRGWGNSCSPVCSKNLKAIPTSSPSVATGSWWASNWTGRATNWLGRHYSRSACSSP